MKIGLTLTGGKFSRKEIGRPQQRPAATSASASAKVERGGQNNVAMANFSPLERRAKRRKRRGHHDATKVSSHAGIDTLFQAPFTTRRARDDCAKSEEVRGMDASVIERDWDGTEKKGELTQPQHRMTGAAPDHGGGIGITDA